MGEGREPLIQDLGQSLRMKVFRKFAHDPNQFTLPGLKARRMFLDEIQQVVLRFRRESIGLGEQRGLGQWRRPKARKRVLSIRSHGRPHAFGLRLAFAFGIKTTRALVSINAMVL